MFPVWFAKLYRDKAAACPRSLPSCSRPQTKRQPLPGGCRTNVVLASLAVDVSSGLSAATTVEERLLDGARGGPVLVCLGDVHDAGEALEGLVQPRPAVIVTGGGMLTKLGEADNSLF